MLCALREEPPPPPPYCIVLYTVFDLYHLYVKRIENQSIIIMRYINHNDYYYYYVKYSKLILTTIPIQLIIQSVKFDL